MNRKISDRIQCKICGSFDTVKDGRQKCYQRWECKSCKGKFVDNKARYGMKTPDEQVFNSIQMYYQGMSLNNILRYLRNSYDNYASVSTVYDWISKYRRIANQVTKEHHPIVGDSWLINVSMVCKTGVTLWIRDVIDRNTHFLITSMVSPTNNYDDFQILMNRATNKALIIPDEIVSENVSSYITTYNDKMRINQSHDKIECLQRFHAVFECRKDVIRNIKGIERITDFVDGWQTHYNYFRPQITLDGYTPSEIANIKYIKKIERRIRRNNTKR